MWRSILARHASRNTVTASSRFQVALSNPNFLKPSSKSTSLSSSSSRVFPQFAYFHKTPRFFSNEASLSLSVDSSENDGGVVHEAIAEEEEKVVEEEEEEKVVEEEEEMYEIDVNKLENVLSLLKTSADGSLESCLDDMDLTLHQDLLIKIIETPFVLGENLIRFFNWACNEKSFKVTTPVVESLVFVICSGLKKKQIYILWDLVKDIGEKEENGVINVRILNELIISFSKLGKGKAALEAFDKFEVFHCVPNEDTYYFTIEALCRRSAFDWAWTVCQKMLDAQSLPDGEKVGNMLCWFCKGKKAKEAHAVYMAAIEKGKRPPMSSMNFLIAKLCQENENVQLAFEMLNDIPGERRKHAIKSFSAVVRALCRIKDVDAAKELILKMIADGPPPGNAVFNFVITAYCKVGEMGQALEMVKLLESRGLKPDVYTYTVLASGYSNGGEMEEARKILGEAKKKHVKLSPVMYHTLIRGYCKLEQFDKALELLIEMKDFGVCPSVDEYEKLIQSLCLKALDWEKAEKLQEEMKENGLHLKGITRALIRAVKEVENEVVEAESISSVA
ncbi:small ribosomal subunit protein mS80 (rPPR6) [Gastrolobium bilobum]|uniref:small ribosomal subunit protein mS80 (rPPR6) n=1 Tax=Gastrolobium bilobum TaxID=150636 RepID=UPI002AB172EC|nr:small ribosomal subunit protein mS80 (rPPR6) [Gastrolobium bilobum]